MTHIDLVWTGIAVVGGLLLIDSLTTTKAQLGAWLIFLAFLFQVYWEFTHPWNSDSLWHVIDISVIIIFGFAFAFGRPFFRKLLKRQN